MLFSKSSLQFITNVRYRIQNVCSNSVGVVAAPVKYPGPFLHFRPCQKWGFSYSDKSATLIYQMLGSAMLPFVFRL